MIWCLLTAFSATFAAAQERQPFFQEALKYEGRRITSIQFEPVDQPLSSDQLERLLPFHIGSTFHERDLHVAIQRLFGTGRFSDMAVDATDLNNGVALRFITKRAYFVGRVVIRGVKAPPNAGELSSATKLRLGTPYTSADKNQAIESLRNVLRQNGFYNAKINAEIEFRPETEQANLAFDVDTGKRARFQQPDIAGAPGQAAKTIVAVTHWKRIYGLLGWQEVTEVRVLQGLENIRRYYEKKNLLDSRVTLTRLQYHNQTNTVEPALEVQTGVRIVLRAVGARISASKLKQLVPIFQEHSVDTDLLLEGERNIQQYLIADGYFGAEVTYETAARP